MQDKCRGNNYMYAVGTQNYIAAFSFCVMVSDEPRINKHVRKMSNPIRCQPFKIMLALFPPIAARCGTYINRKSQDSKTIQ